MPRSIPQLRAYVTMLLASLLLAGAVPSVASAQTAAPEVVYVNQQSPSASNTNPGTQDRPLQTIGAGLKRAQSNRAAGKATVVRVADGTYREQIGSVLGDGSPITIEAINPGKVVFSGSDVFRDWRPAGDGSYTRAWPYDWGTEPNPWASSTDVAPLARRHEAVFVNGALVRQVLSRDQLAEGTFLVDEAANQITLRPAAGVDMASALVEIGVRRRIFQIQRGSNLTVRGIVFQHSSEALDGAGVWFIDMNNVLIEDCVMRWNNAVGLKVNTSRNVTIRRTVAQNNGMDGIGAYKVQGLLVEDSVTAYNNWRGSWAGFYGWAIGQKFMYLNGAVIRRHQSIGNQTRGLWLDTNSVNVVVEGGLFKENRRDGLFVEASNGPVTVRQSKLLRNGSAGVLIIHSGRVTLDGNVLCDNKAAQIQVNGTSSARTITDWLSKQVIDLLTVHTTIVNNTVAGSSSGQLLFLAKIPSDPWARFVSTFTAGGNRWSHSVDQRAFRVSGDRLLDFPTWQQQTRQDATSTFARQGNPPECQG